jgi:hypothetical protein
MPRAPREKPTDQPALQEIVVENNAATGGHGDEPVPLASRRRSARADDKRAAAKAAGVMSVSTKTAADIPIDAAEPDPRPRARRVPKPALEVEEAPTRVRRSNAEIAADSTVAARKSPAPRSAQTEAGFASPSDLTGERAGRRTGATRQRVPAPGNATAAKKRAAVTGDAAAGGGKGRSTASSGGAKPPKKSARAGHTTAAGKVKGADRGGIV